MTVFHIRLDIHSSWIAGSGDGDGAQADKVVSTIGGGLPYLPGRTLKGLLRDACRTWVQCNSGSARYTEFKSRLDELFGSDIPNREAGSTDHRRLEETRLNSVQAKLSVTNALPAPVADHGRMIQWSLSDLGRAHCRHMIQHVASTRINELGVAEDQTLRTVEVVIPMPLHAELRLDTSNSEDTAALVSDATEILRGGAALLRQLGSSRHRGFGRVTTTMTTPAEGAA